jgi:hypothetical protein
MDRPTLDWFVKYLPRGEQWLRKLSHRKLQVVFDGKDVGEGELRRRVYLLGQCMIAVEVGAVTINNFTLRPHHGPHYLCSPKTHALLCLEPADSSGLTVVTLESVSNGLERIQQCQGSFQGIFSTSSLAPGTESASSDYGDEDITGLGILKRPIPADVTLYEPVPEWQRVSLELVTQSSSSTAKPVIVVCGPRKVGKSSFCRHVVNTLLSSQSPDAASASTSMDGGGVIMVDLDMGQTEFMPPGTLSAKLVTRAILDPPFCHVGTADLSVPVGCVAPSDDLQTVLQGYAWLLTAVLERHQGRRPIVVNTIGWITGLGLHLLQFAVQFVRPSHVIGFVANHQGDTSYISSALYDQCPLYRSVMRLEPFSPVEPAVAVAVVPAVGEGGATTRVASPADLRALSLWAYFFRDASTQMFFFGQRGLAELTPYVLPWDDLLRVQWTAHREQRAAVANGALAALGRVESPQDPQMTLIGVGMIRGLDPRRRCYYVVSPLTVAQWDTVNAVFFGTVPIPPPMFHHRNPPNGPYLTLAYQSGNMADPSAIIVGGGARKTRYNLQRGPPSAP